jgi:hypothetical protein
MRHLSIATSLLLASASSSVARAQTAPAQRGLASSLAATLSLGDAGRGAAEATLAKAPGNQSNAPGTWGTQSFTFVNDLSLSALFGARASLVEIDAHTSGNDFIPNLGDNGEPILTQSWLSLIVSVDNQSQGTEGSLIRRAATGGRQPGADLIGYYFWGSQGIDSQLVDRTVLEQTRADLGFQSTTREVDALDFGSAVLAFARGSRVSPLFTRQGDYFFSLTKQSAANLPKFATSGLDTVDADGATIYGVTMGASGWGTPYVYLSANTLGLDPAVDETDALAIDPSNGVVVFSTARDVKATYSDQLLAYQAGKGVKPLKNGRGDLVVDKIDLDDLDDVDGLCIIDPESNQLATHLGTPQGSIPYGPVPMGISATRSGDLSTPGFDWLHVQATGWGSGDPDPATVQFWWTIDDTRIAPENASWSALSPFLPRQPEEEALGFSVQIPSDLNQPNVSIVAVQINSQGILLSSFITRLDFLP